MPNLTSILGLSGALPGRFSREIKIEEGGAESNLVGGASTKIELRSQAWLILSFVDPKGFEMRRFCAEERSSDREERREERMN